MNTTIKCCLAFVGGAAIGAAVAWKLLESKFEKLAQEEIDSVKETLLNRNKASEPKEKESDDVPKPVPTSKSSLDGYHKPNDKERVDYSSIRTSDVAKKMADVEKPCVIPPNEFGEYYDYETIGLTHYSDGVLTDESDEMIDDIGGAVGEDYADHFGEYEEDAVHIRNDVRKCYYEILRDYRKYSDVVGSNPHQMEG